MKLLQIRWTFLLFALPIFCCSNPSASKQDGGRKLSAAELKNDFTILRKTLEEAHPGLYWYSPKEETDHRFDSSYALLDHAMGRKEFFQLLLPLVAGVRCVHTSLRPGPGPENQPIQLARLLPFDLLCTAEGLYITHDFTNRGYAGMEILSINKVSSKEIISRLLTCLPADGYNQTFKYDLLSRGAMREGYALYWGQPESFALKLRSTATPKEITVAVKAAPPQQLATRQALQPSPAVSVHFHDSLNLAVLEVNTFELRTEKFRELVVPVFKKIREKGIENLVIDLRRNGGGNNNNVPELFSFLATRPFLHLKKTAMNPPVYTYKSQFKNPENFSAIHGVQQPDGSYSVNGRYTGTVYRDPARQYGFRGNTILLISGHTTSAASEFAAIAHDNKRVTVVGEETGGCYYGATGGNYINLVLPASKLEARIPTIRIFTAVEEDLVRQPQGRGLLPDYPVVQTVAAILQGRDVQLEAAIKLIKNKGT
ncbi:MAG: hypothetical protein INR73_14775 [Williamsia sp.]|nr:hypothetical protein [Williamsia sp.]